MWPLGRDLTPGLGAVACPFSHLHTHGCVRGAFDALFFPGCPSAGLAHEEAPSPGSRGWVVPEVREEEGSERVGDGVGPFQEEEVACCGLSSSGEAVPGFVFLLKGCLGDCEVREGPGCAWGYRASCCWAQCRQDTATRMELGCRILTRASHRVG